MIKRPVPHDSDALSLPIGSRSAGLEQLVERLEAKAPVSAWRAIPPHVCGHVRQEMVLRAVEADVLWHGLKQRCMLELEIVQALYVAHVELVLHGQRVQLHQLHP